MFHDFCQSVTLVFCQRTHVSHDHHPRGPCCSRARISYDEPYMGAISYQKIFASALIGFGSLGAAAVTRCGSNEGLEPTPSSVRCAPASGRGSGPALSVRTEPA